MSWCLRLIIVGIVLVSGLSVGYRIGKSGATEVSTDTIFVIDTIKVTQPIAVESKELGFKNYRIKLLGRVKQSDTLSNQEDSIEIALPITQKVYADSIYKAWISGFDARLDSIQVYQPTRYITITKEEKNRLYFGLQAGYGITPKGLQPYIGVGLTYKLRIR